MLDSAITQLTGYLTQPLMYTMQIAGDGQTCIPEKSGFTRPPRGLMSGRMAALRSVRSLAGGRTRPQLNYTFE